MQDAVKDLLERRCRRACRTILTVKEEVADPNISLEDSRRFRKVILDQVNEFHDLCVDIIESLDNDTATMNELYLRKIEDIHDYIQQLPYDDM